MTDEQFRKLLDSQENAVVANTGYTQAELKNAFDLVADAFDWKASIEAYVSSDEVKIVAIAIEHFTATQAKFDYIGIVNDTSTRFAPGTHVLKVRAVGYRSGPAGDH
jgi:hypothetical protein